MILKDGTEVTPLDVELAAMRAVLRMSEFGSTDWRDGGACSPMAEAIHLTYGLAMDGGCYVTADGRHIAHYWNAASDGSILDATADQFGEPGLGIRRRSGGDPRYDNSCGCGRDG